MESRSSRLIAAATLAAVLALGGALPGQAPSPQDRARAAARAGERIRALLREAEDLAAQQSKLLVELRRLEVERQNKSAELARLEGELKDTEAAVAEAGTRAEGLRSTAETERPAIERTLVRIYKMGGAGYWRMLLDVDDLRSVGRAYRTASALTRLDRHRVYAHQQTLEALAGERKNLQVRSARLTALHAEARAARAALDRAVAAHTSMVDTIDARRDLNQQMTSELQAAQQRLQGSLAQAESVSTASLALPLGAFRGALPWPARGRVASPFGRQTNTRFGTAIARNGLELAVPEGQQVLAVHEGTVAFADAFTGYGTLVILEHGEGAFSLYGHLGSLQITRGQRIEAGSPIGTSGRNPTGNPALYFELRVDGRPVDPLQWLQKGTQ